MILRVAFAMLFSAACLAAQSPAPFPEFPPPDATYPGANFTFVANVGGGSGFYSYLWKQIYGPAPAGIQDPNKATTAILMTVPGTYTFRFTVIDQTDGSKYGYADYSMVFGSSYKPTVPPASAGLTVSISNVVAPENPDPVKPVINSVKRSLNGATVDATTGAGATIAATATGVTFTVSAADNIAVASAELIVDGFRVASIGTAGSFLPGSFDMRWNQKVISTGPHTFTLRVFDDSNNYAEKSWVMTR